MGEARYARRLARLWSMVRTSAAATWTWGSDSTGSELAAASSRLRRYRARERSDEASSSITCRSPLLTATNAQAERSDNGRPGVADCDTKASDTSSTTHCEPIRSADKDPSAMR